MRNLRLERTRKQGNYYLEYAISTTHRMIMMSYFREDIPFVKVELESWTP